MALINCPECGHQMSDTATKCPNCGYKRVVPFDWKKYRWLIGLSIIIMVLCWMIISVCTMSNWGGKFVLDHYMFISGSIMFAFGFIPLFFGCRMLKSAAKLNIPIFTYISLFCVIVLGFVFFDMGVRTEQGWKERWEYLDKKYSSGNSPSDKEQGTNDPTITWSYTTDVDDLTGKTKGFNAHITSTNSATSKYGESDRLVIQLSYNSITRKPSNMFGIAFEKGNCYFANSNSQGFYAVFDNGEVNDTWTLCNGGNNKSIVMISDGFSASENKINSFINKLKNAKTCKIQVNIDGVGMKTFNFNCEGLDWNY